MRIEPGDMIAGLSAIAIRDFLRYMSSGFWDAADLHQLLYQRLQLPSIDAAQQLFRALVDLGYIGLEDTKWPDRGWRITEQGLRLAGATAAKPLRRTSADGIVRGLLDRVEQVNSNKAFLYKVTKIVAFGSYLADQERISDIDLGITLEPKEADWDKQFALEEKHSRAAMKRGRSFSTYTDRLAWPREEVMLFLRSRSRALSLFQGDDPVLELAETKTIYEQEE